MSRWKSALVGLAVVALIVAMPAGVVLAQEEAPPLEEEQHTLTAEGYGVAAVSGWGAADIETHGASVVWIRNADVMAISGEGEREDTDDGVVRLVDWAGRIHIEGERFNVRMAGGHLDFVATGRGRAYLQGYGTFQMDDRQGRWPWLGMHVPPQAPRRAMQTRLHNLRDRLQQWQSELGDTWGSDVTAE